MVKTASQMAKQYKEIEFECQHDYAEMNEGYESRINPILQLTLAPSVQDNPSTKQAPQLK